MSAPIRILHLDDSPLDAQLVAFTLDAEKSKFPTTLTYVQTREQYLEALGRKDFDIILSDYRMPDYDGDGALKAALAQCPDIPFIMVTGELGEELVIETLKRGATDYVLKDRAFRLVPAIRRALTEAENNRRRRVAEAALTRALQQASETLESIQDAFYSVDSQWHITYVNSKAETFMQKTGAELLGGILWELFPQTIGTESEMVLRKCMRERVPVQYETRSAVFGAWIDVHVFPKADGGISVLYRDIAERKSAEEMIRQQAALIDLVPDAVIVRAIDGTISFWNRGAEALYGWSAADAMGKKTHDLLRTEFPESFETVKRHLSEQKSWEGELVQWTRDQKKILIRSRWSLHEQATHGTVLLESNIDITSQKARERALRMSEERFALAFRTNPYPLAVSRVRDGVFLDMNEAFLALYGMTREEMAGHSSLELGILVDPKEREELVQTLRRNGVVRSFEMRIRTRHRGERMVLLSVSLLKESDELTMLTIVYDVTAERKLAEERGRRREATSLDQQQEEERRTRR